MINNLEFIRLLILFLVERDNCLYKVKMQLPRILKILLKEFLSHKIFLKNFDV